MKLHRINIWYVLSFLIIFAILIPFFVLTLNMFSPNNDTISSIFKNWIFEYTKNTLIILAFTALFSSLIAVPLAFVFSYYEFPFKKALQVFIVMPLSIPAYVMAYTYSDMFSFTGTFQTFFRNVLKVQVDQKLFEFMNLRGIIFIFSISLFPYIFLLVSSFLKKQSSLIYENARVLGMSPLKSFFKVIIPISMPVIFSSTILVLMEVLSDYGVTSYFGIHTFSTAIYQVWFGMQDISSAIKLSIFMIILSILFVCINSFLKIVRKQQSTGKSSEVKPIKLKGIYNFYIIVYIFCIILITSIIPLVQLIFWAFDTYKDVLNYDFIKLVSNTLILGGISTLIILIFSIIISNTNRIYDTKTSRLFTTISSIGYATPSTVLALGILIVFISIDNFFKINLSGKIILIVCAYVIKYFGVGVQSIETGFNRVGKTYLNNARMLGVGITKSFFLVDFFTIKSSIISCFLLVFIDIIKELPITLLIRPFNFNTLATKVYFYAGDEQVKKAAIPALLIIFICSFFSYILMYKQAKKHN